MTRRPRVRIKQQPRKRVRTRGGRATVRFRFRSKLAGAKFECRIDERRFRSCSSPKRYRVKRGRHKFKVRALNGKLPGRRKAYRFRVIGG